MHDVVDSVRWELSRWMASSWIWSVEYFSCGSRAISNMVRCEAGWKVLEALNCKPNWQQQVSTDSIQLNIYFAALAQVERLKWCLQFQNNPLTENWDGIIFCISRRLSTFRISKKILFSVYGENIRRHKSLENFKQCPIDRVELCGLDFTLMDSLINIYIRVYSLIELLKLWNGEYMQRLSWAKMFLR